MDFVDFRVNDIHGVVRYKPTSAAWNAENRRNHIVGIQLSGNVHHTFSHGEFTISEKCVYFLNQKDKFKARVIDSSEAFSIHFTTDENISTDSFCACASNSSKIISILQKAERAMIEKDSLALKGYLYQLCAEIERCRKKEYFKTDARIVTAKEYIDARFKEKECLSAAIKESGVCARRFGELFRKAYDITPNKYLVSRRIDYAAGLLLTDTLSVTEISEICGFSDVYYFSKVFKSEMGITPSKWRRQIS